MCNIQAALLGSFYTPILQHRLQGRTLPQTCALQAAAVTMSTAGSSKRTDGWYDWQRGLTSGGQQRRHWRLVRNTNRWQLLEWLTIHSLTDSHVYGSLLNKTNLWLAQITRHRYDVFTIVTIKGEIRHLLVGCTIILRIRPQAACVRTQNNSWNV